MVARSTQDPRLTMPAIESDHEAQQGMPVMAGELTRQLDEYFEQPRFHTALLMYRTQPCGPNPRGAFADRGAAGARVLHRSRRALRLD